MDRGSASTLLLLTLATTCHAFCPNQCGYSDKCQDYSSYEVDCAEIMPAWTTLFSIFFPLYLLIGIYTGFQLCRLFDRPFNIQLLVHIFTLVMTVFGMVQHACGILINDTSLSYEWHKARERMLEISVGLSNWAFFSMLYMILLFWIEILRTTSGIGIMQRLRCMAFTLTLLLLVVEVVHRVMNVTGHGHHIWVPVLYCVYYFITTMVVVVGMNVYARRIKKRLQLNGNKGRYTPICAIGTATTVIGIGLMVTHNVFVWSSLLIPHQFTNGYRLTLYYVFPTLKLALVAVVLIGLRPRKNPTREINAHQSLVVDIEGYQPLNEEPSQADKIAALLSPTSRDPSPPPSFYPVPSHDVRAPRGPATFTTTPRSLGSSLSYGHGAVFDQSPLMAQRILTPVFMASPATRGVAGQLRGDPVGAAGAAPMFASLGG